MMILVLPHNGLRQDCAGKDADIGKPNHLALETAVA
jgi:hypothetical protein